MKPTIDLALAGLEIFGGADDAEVTADVPDPFQKFMEEASLAGALGMGASSRQHAHNLGVEAQERETAFANHYRKIADAARKTPPGDPQQLKKQFSQPDPKAGYRQFFRERVAKGQTATQALNEWLTGFPHHNPDVEKLMREVSTEF